MAKKIKQTSYRDVRPWAKGAVAEEDKRPAKRLWKGERTPEQVKKEQAKRVRFLRKNGRTEPRADRLADRLEHCRPDQRCLSGACLQCAQLLQRWFVRQSRKFIANHLKTRERQLIAISIVPPDSPVLPGQLNTFSIVNFQRRLKYILAKADVRIAIGGVDFSFNEDRKGKYQPFWNPHFYLITRTAKRDQLRRALIKRCQKTPAVPRPIKISPFENTARRRSYALKTQFGRRIGYDQKKEGEDQARNCRNTSRDKLRAPERLELFLLLDQIGLAMRPFFLGVKPHVSSDGVRLKRWGDPRRIKVMKGIRPVRHRIKVL